MRMYATFRIWNEYLVTREYRDRNTACDRFYRKKVPKFLTQAFQTENVMNFNSDTGKPERFHTGSLYFRNTPAEITRLELWFPDNRRRTECVAAYSSFYPLITYYLNRLNDWAFVSVSAKSVENIFWQKTSVMNYAVISAVKHRHFKIKGNLMNEPEKITMICFIKMNARIGVIKSINPKNC